MIRFNKQRKVFWWDGLSTQIPDSHGLTFNPQLSLWETSKMRVAARLRQVLHEDAKKTIDAVSCKVLEPWTRGLLLPPNKNLDPWQELGVRHILERNQSYIAFEQGIGKTPTAICAINCLRERTLIVCPPSLTGTWLRHFKEWSFKTKVEVYKYETFSLNSDCDVLICPDTLLDDPFTLDTLRLIPHRFLVVEEAHRFVNMTARRTEALFGNINDALPGGLVHKFEKATFLSGTPMPNRPIELFPVLKACAANLIDFRDKVEYGIRWCGAYEGPFGWRFDRSTNEEDLHKRLKVFMRREEKEGKGFATKSRTIVYFGGGKNAKDVDSIVELEKAVLGKRTLNEFMKWQQDSGWSIGQNRKLAEVAKYRSAVGMQKVNFAVDRVREIMNEGKESVLLVGWHTDVLLRAERKLQKFDPRLIHGQLRNMKTRDQYIRQFEAGATRLLIANIQTMVGYNIPKATRVVFMEYSWTPKDNEQAEDRAHRRGSTKRVLVEYLVLTGTLDEYVLQAFLKKKTTIAKVISGV